MERSKSILIALFSLCAALLFSCEEEESPSADFEVEFEGACSSPTLKTIFRNQSQNAASFYWDFGDGSFSSEEKPVKVYAKAGTYQVTLTAIHERDSAGITKEITTYRNSDGSGPAAGFTFAEDALSRKVTFSADEENADVYLWDFGDGTIPASGTEIMEHTYPGPGIYKVSLIVSDANGANCSGLTINTGP